MAALAGGGALLAGTPLERAERALAYDASVAAGASIAQNAAGQHISCAYYELDLPAHWTGRVFVEGPDEAGELTVYPNEYPDWGLLGVRVFDSSQLVGGGDISGGIIRWWDDGFGNSVYLSAGNTVYYSQMGMFNDSTQENILLDLGTGGAYSVEEARASNQGSGSMDGFGYCDAVIASTLVTPPGSLASPQSVLRTNLTDERVACNASWDLSNVVFDVPANAQEQALPTPMSTAFTDLDTQATFHLQTLGPTVGAQNFPLLAYRIAELYDGQLAYHTQLVGELAMDVYTVDLAPMTWPASPSTGRLVLGFIAPPNAGDAAVLFQCEVAIENLDAATAAVQTVFESVRAGGSGSQWTASSDEEDYARAVLLAACYDRLSGYDAEIASAAGTFNETWASDDLALRTRNHAALRELRGRIRSEAVFLIGLDVPASSAYRWNYTEILALLEDLDGRIEPIASGWEKSVAYSTEAAANQEDVFLRIARTNNDAGVNRSKQDYMDRYPFARPGV